MHVAHVAIGIGLARNHSEMHRDTMAITVEVSRDWVVIHRDKQGERAGCDTDVRLSSGISLTRTAALLLI